MSKNVPVIVLTPVRNEEALLDLFLRIVSTFADAIILLDQSSTDRSAEIAKKFPKVYWFTNSSAEYNESERIKRLHHEARKLYPNKKVILSLDVDEIPAAGFFDSPDWEIFIEKPPGSSLWVEKIDLCGSLYTGIRYKDYYPYAWVDDGLEFEPNWIHSFRVPVNRGLRLHSTHLNLLHLAFLSPKIQQAKNRMYSMLERIHDSSWKGQVRRRWCYRSRQKSELCCGAESIPKIWIDGWKGKGIDIVLPQDSESSWHVNECLKMFEQYGTRKFWLEPIWDFEWNKISLNVNSNVESVLNQPSLTYKILAKLIDYINYLRHVLNFLK